MANLNKFLEITSLTESVEYPDGANVVEVLGTGDERPGLIVEPAPLNIADLDLNGDGIQDLFDTDGDGIVDMEDTNGDGIPDTPIYGGQGGYDWRLRPIYPRISITGPVSMPSDGQTVATLEVTIHDPNSANPFFLQAGMFESCTPDTPQTFSTEYWITRIVGCWEDQTKVYPIALEYLVFKENQVYISDSFRANGASANWLGLLRPEVYIEYDGYMTLDIEDGLQVTEQWWKRAGDDERQTEVDVSGRLFLDSAGSQENTSSLAPIPNTMGQDVTVYFYYRPDSGEEGIAYLNAAYNGLSVSWPITVLSGAYTQADISMSAEPSTIPPGGVSVVTLTASDTNGGAIYGTASQPRTVTFFIQAGNGSINPAEAQLEIVTGQEEEIESSTATTFSLTNPVVKLTGLVVIGGGGFTWNGQYTKDGNEITLVNQAFPLEVCPIRATYDWGGQAKTIYTATGDRHNDKVFIAGRLGAGANALTSISIDDPAISGSGEAGDVSLSISAADNALNPGETTDVVATCYVNGVGKTTGVKFTLIPNKGTLSMRSSNPTIVDEECSISDRKTVSTNYTIASISKVVHESVEYSVESFDGNTIIIAGTGFPVAAGTAFVTYTSAGVFRGLYQAHATETDYTAYLNIIYSGEMATDTVNVGAGDGADVGDSLTVSVSPPTIKRGETATVSASVLKDGQPVVDTNILFKVAVGPGHMDPLRKASDAQGEATSEFVTTATSPLGRATINVTGVGQTKTVEVTVTKADEDAEEDVANKTTKLPAVTISGWVDPATRTYLLSNGATVSDWGVAAQADSSGCTDADIPGLGEDGWLYIKNTGNDALAWDIVGVEVTGGNFTPDEMQKIDPFYLDAIEVGIPWDYVENVARQQFVRVVDKMSPELPIVGATVSLGGRSATTDQDGVARFTGISPGVYQIGITHPNYKDNRQGVTGGVGVYDSDTSNDSFTVKDYSQRQWLLNKMTINISITYTVIMSTPFVYNRG